MDIGKINFPVKIDFRFKLHLETKIKKTVCKSGKIITGVSTVGPNAKWQQLTLNNIHKAPFIQYEQLLLDKNFRQYLETIVVSKEILRMRTQEFPLQKTYKINVGVDSIEIDFLISNK